MSDAPLDLLVVGGGPGGTAAALRASELGYQVLVIDHDDLMKRIRDYAKDKLILPGFGGGDRMCFPKAGERIARLRFEPIDKDDLCQRYRELYQEYEVTVRTGVELLGLDGEPDGSWTARVWNHAERLEESLRARTVVLAIGRGVPRRLDIPGPVEGIAHRLSDAEAFVGEPACVIGGGTSAAEAVIAISRAKVRAGDATAVYWSYRGEKMPRVSKALSEVFFEAYVGNGNIRYHPRSEPAAVLVGEGQREMLAVRIDRRAMTGRPHETTHLEFAKEFCLACIGEEVPESLLAEIGIRRVTAGPASAKRFVVTPWLESQQRNIFLVGDLLCQAYLEAPGWDSPAEAWREVKHRGNIKSALRDGVLAAEAIHQRLQGREPIEVHLEDDQEPAEEEPRVAPRPVAEVPEAAEGEPGAVLIRLLPGGVEAEEFAVAAVGVTTIGSGSCDVRFPDDTLLSPAHASIARTGDRYLLRDDGSENGVFLRLRPAEKTVLREGDLLQVGRQYLRLAAGADRENGPRFDHFDARGREVGRHPVAEGPVIVGRQGPGLTLDPKDATLSRRHLAIGAEPAGVWVKDLKSANGTYLRVRAAVPLVHGDRFRAGQQQLELRVGEKGERPAPAAAPEPASTPPPQPAAGSASAAEGATVAFEGIDRQCPLRPEETVCEAAEAHGVPITAECHSGICGSDPVRILAGGEHVAEGPGDQESETLRDLCGLDPGEHRLACMLKLRGPVTVRLVEPKE